MGYFIKMFSTARDLWCTHWRAQNPNQVQWHIRNWQSQKIIRRVFVARCVWVNYVKLVWIAGSFAFSSNIAKELQCICVDYVSAEEALQLRSQIPASEKTRSRFTIRRLGSTFFLLCLRLSVCSPNPPRHTRSLLNTLACAQTVCDPQIQLAILLIITIHCFAPCEWRSNTDLHVSLAKREHPARWFP